jgi:NAD(P)-dependent dehydrogenase (short-subunit alcohol dehydrogenase family)
MSSPRLPARSSLRGKVVVVTGASGGVGRATVRELAQRGAKVALLARGEERLANARAEAEAMGVEALAIIVDIAEAEQVFAAADRIERELGPIDVWINNAMATVFSTLRETSPEAFRRVTDVTYHGQVYGTMAALRHMRPRNRGVIVSVGSALAYRGIPLQAAYCGAKHAVLGFMESIRSELLHDEIDVKVTEVHLPAVNTPQFEWSLSHMEEAAKPLGKIFQPEVAARAIADAAERPRREVYVGAPVYQTVLGDKVMPGVLDHHLAKVGYEGQLRRGEPPNPVANLFEPPPGDYGAHGPFDDVAKSRALAYEVGHRLGGPPVMRALLAISALFMAAFGGYALGRRRPA